MFLVTQLGSVLVAIKPRSPPLTFKGLLFDCCHSPVRGSFNQFPPPLPTNDGFSRLPHSNLLSSCCAPAECSHCQAWGLELVHGVTSHPSSSGRFGAALAFNSIRKTEQQWIWEPGPAGLGSCCLQGRCCGVGCARPQIILMGSLPSTADPWPPGMHRAEGLLPPELWQRICKGQSISVHQALEIPLGPPQQGQKC